MLLGGSNADVNYGGNPSMYLRHQNATWGNNFSVVKFDLSSIPDNAVVTAAQMRFYTAMATWPETPTNFAPVALFKNTEDWDEASVTFNTAPALDSAALMTVEHFFNGECFTGSSTIDSSTLEWLQFSGDPLVNLVQDWVDGTQSNFGVTLAATGQYLSDGRIFSFKTKDHPTAAVRPYLVIDYTLGEAAASSGLVFSIRSEEGSVPVPEAKAFLDKAASGEPIVVAYLGGSITVGAATWPLSGTNAADESYDFSSYDRDMNSWRALTYEWLRTQYEKTAGQFRQVDAAIGGTPSLLGAYRLEQDVLSQNPDLVFVEFAVNDSSVATLTQDDPSAARSMLRTCRSIIDRLRAQNPDVMIFIPLSTHRVLDGSASEAWSVTLDLGHDQMRLAAEMLQVPYVSIKESFENSRPEGQDPYYDGPDTAGNYVHPAPAGHRAYAETVERVLSSLFATGHFKFSGEEESVEPSPVSPALVLPEILAEYATGWMVEMPQAVEVPILEGHACLVGDEPGDVLDYTFTGSAIGLWLDNQSSGTVAVQLDGTSLGAFSGRFSSLATDLDSSVSHTLRIVPSADSYILLRALTVDQDDI
jgi:lysophospholipase L1-like esterase